jgi:hypothetical protein
MHHPTQGTELEQLTKTVSDLATALAHSERRHAHLARSLRWGALILVTLLVGGTALLVDRFGAVYAQQGAIPEASDAVSALNRINQNLALFGMMGETLQSAVPAIEKAMMENPDVQKSVQIYLQAQGIEPTQDNMMAYAAPAITHSAVTTMVDAIVLMQRIRDDSNKFRDLIGGPGPALRGLERELHLMNVALASVPAMTAQMDLMNRNMATMSYSIGSTMGRMGSWIP